MDEHITFEELTRFVWMEQVTPETMALSLRVNRHLMQCDDCARRMARLQSLHEDAMALRRRRAQLAMANRKLREVNEELLPKYYAGKMPKIEQEHD